MNPRPSFHRGLAGRLSLVVALLACAVAPTSAAGPPASGAASNLSPRLAELARPAVAAAPRAEQAARLSLAPDGPGSLLRDGGRILVDVRFDSGAVGAVDALRAAGAEIVHVSGRYQVVTVAARPGDLAAIGALAGVRGVVEVLAPLVRAAGCPSGIAVSEGDAQLNAAHARADFGLDGSGVTVGILSDSFDQAAAPPTGAAADVASGDLPGSGNPCGYSSPVAVLESFVPREAGETTADEGRAMAQIVHDLAPGAAIDFATAFNGEFDFADNIRALRNAGARVIADDVTYLDEPFFQDGPVAVAVNEVAAAGVSYFSAAGNDNLIDGAGRDIASWEAPSFRDSGSCPAAVVDLSEELEAAEVSQGLTPQGLHPSHCMDFDPGGGSDDTFGVTVKGEKELAVDLQWAETWNGVGTDLDAFLLDEAGNLVSVDGAPVAAIEDNVGDSQRPFEFLSWENEGAEEEVQIVVNRFSGAGPRLKFALLQNRGGIPETEYSQSAGGDVVGPTIFGHSGAEGAIGVGAVHYSYGAAPERYSSRGPVKHYFGPVIGTGPAAATGERTIAKPDLVATDCGVTTFFFRLDPAQQPPFRFCGTSAAAPHAAAVAALMRQANPGASAAQVRSTLTSTAHPVGAFGPDAVGAGLIDAYGAVRALALPPTVTITKPPAALSRNRRPTIEFGANRPVAFSCQVDGGIPQPCSSPYGLPVALADGGHAIAVTGVDLAGRSGSALAGFEVDTKRPRTRIAKHPRKLIRTHKRNVRARFRFASNEPGSIFVCKVDRRLLRFCKRNSVFRVTEGRHLVKVRARDRAGNVDVTPAVFRFRVKRVG